MLGTLPKLEATSVVYSGALSAPGNWSCAYVRTEIPWPNKVHELLFSGRVFFLIPPTQHGADQTTFPAIALKLQEGESIEVGAGLTNQLLSAMTWISDKPARVDQWGGGSRPYPCLGGTGTILTDRFYMPDLPEPSSEKEKLALGLYREGRSMDHTVYACLSYFKIINILHNHSSAQRAWIKGAVNHLRSPSAIRRLGELNATVDDVGKYLYETSRCAIAHAFSSPLVNPDDPLDERRLRQDYPLVKGLASVAVERDFGIKSAATIYAEHLYELAGFKELFPVEQRSDPSAMIELCQRMKFPRLKFALVGREEYAPLALLEADFLRNSELGAILQCKSVHYPVSVQLHLNFSDERLQVDTLNGIWCIDDGSADAAFAVSEMLRFRWDYHQHHILQIFSVEDQQLLGRGSPFIPENYFLDAAQLSEIERFRVLAEKRREQEATI